MMSVDKQMSGVLRSNHLTVLGLVKFSSLLFVDKSGWHKGWVMWQPLNGARDVHVPRGLMAWLLLSACRTSTVTVLQPCIAEFRSREHAKWRRVFGHKLHLIGWSRSKRGGTCTLTLWSPQLVWMIFKDSVRTAKKTRLHDNDQFVKAVWEK
jgi:hypothetical protein